MKNITTIQQACTGCSACAYVCPKGAIIMNYNREGFLYPIVEGNCIECGLCLLTCPAMNGEHERRRILHCIGAYLDNKKYYQNSSSGGIFAACALHILKQGGCVVGAAMKPDYTVEHIVISKPEDLPQIQGSKYVQSDISSVYAIIADNLKKGKNVIFSGTPCQVVGIKKALQTKKIDDERLVTIDIVCHGVPSPLFFKEHIKTTYGDVQNIKFRHKTAHELSGYAIGYEKDGKYRIIKPTNKDFYYACYSSQVSLRESCYICPFADPERVGDITLGDLATQYRYAVGDEHACCVVTINTEKGKQILEHLVEFIVSENVEYEREFKSNAQMMYSTKRPQSRDTFYSDLFHEGHYDEQNALNYRYVDSLKEKVKQFITKVTTPKLRKRIKALIKK